MPVRSGRAGLLVFSFVLAATMLHGRHHARAGTDGVPAEWTQGPERKAVYLTLDGATSEANVLYIVAALEMHGGEATFFMPGRWLEEHSFAARAILLGGNSLGNRGYDRTRFTSLSAPRLQHSIASGERAIKNLDARPDPYLRAPSGVRNLRVLKIAQRMGYRSLHWTIHPEGGSAAEVAAEILSSTRRGAVVSMNLGDRAHRSALPVVLSGLRSQGLAVEDASPVKKAAPVQWDVTIEPGETGARVRRLQEALKEKTYPISRVDGRFGAETLQAVYAFEKVHDLPRDGAVSAREMQMLVSSAAPAAPPRPETDFIDIDVSRQILLEIRDGRVVNTVPVSTANGEQYVSDGEVRTAVTPTGEFEILWQIPGWRVSDLGELWYPSYFHGAGYAIHGSTSVPPYPASHGCVRVPMHLARPLFGRMHEGLRVYVHD